MTDAASWTEAQCKRIETPAKPHDWRSRYGVFRDVIWRFIAGEVTGTHDVLMQVLDAVCCCAWAEGVSARHINQLYAMAARGLRLEMEAIK